MLITEDPTELQHALRPGDVLAFDSLRSLSGLIQWADNAPVNHLALVLDSDTAVMANRPKAAKGHAVYAVKLDKLLETEHLSAVRTLRSVDDSALGSVLERAAWYLQETTSFGYLDLAWMAPSAIIRSYDQKELLPDAPKLLRTSLIKLLQTAARASLEKIPKDKLTLTCSEFVYRCFIEANVNIEITNPLERQDLIHAPIWNDELVAAEQANWDALRAHNEHARGLRHLSLSSDSEPRPDTVTPADLCRSPSLATTAALIRGQVPTLFPHP